MAESPLQPWQSFKFGRWACKLVACVLVIVLLPTICSFLFSGSETEQEELLIGDQLVKVTIKTSFRRGLGMDHTGISIGRDYYKYKVTLDFSDSKSITFRTEAKPRAIWLLNGQLYFVGRGPEGYLTARLESDGTLLPISRKDLPPGPRPWNFGQRTKEQQQADEDFYQSLGR